MRQTKGDGGSNSFHYDMIICIMIKAMIDRIGQMSPFVSNKREYSKLLVSIYITFLHINQNLTTFDKPGSTTSSVSLFYAPFYLLIDSK